MKRSSVFGVAILHKVFQLAVATVLAAMTLTSGPLVSAALVVQGDVSPDAPATWTEETEAYVGETEWGSVDVMGGDSVASGELTLGKEEGISGALTVGGVGSLIDVDDQLVVGGQGNGALYVINGGTVQSQRSIVAQESEASGAVNVAGAGSTWTSYEVIIGNGAEGSLNITNGGRVESTGGGFRVGMVKGDASEVRGCVTVDGSDSTLDAGHLCVTAGVVSILNGGTIDSWHATIEESATVSASGAGSAFGIKRNLSVAGRLAVLSQAAASVENDTTIFPGSTAEIRLDSTTLTTGSLLASPSNLAGVGTIETHGLVSDVDLCLGSGNATETTLMFDELPGQDVTVHLRPEESGSLGAGYAGEGMLTIGPFAHVQSATGYLGYNAGSVGVADVDRSSWICHDLVVGREGHGELNVFRDATMRVASSTVIGQMPGSSGSVTVAGAGSTLSSRGIVVGKEGVGVVFVRGGATVSAEMTEIGTDSITRGGRLCKADGSVTISDHGSTWNTSVLWLGGLGKGTMSVTGGGACSCYTAFLGPRGTGETGGSGSVSIDGAGSYMNVQGGLAIGKEGRGTLEVSNGGKVTSGYTTIGADDSSSGAVRIAGIGSTWMNVGGIQVGGAGSAELRIVDGGTVMSGDGGIGGNTVSSSDKKTATVTVEDLGSTWTIRQDLVVGSAGAGSLKVTNGGLVTNVNACIGEEAGSVGNVAVGWDLQWETPSLWINRSKLTVGKAGGGVLRVESGGKVESGSAVIAEDCGAWGVVDIAGLRAEWVNDWGIEVGGRGDALLRIAEGGMVRTRRCEVNSNGVLCMNVGRQSRLVADQLLIQNGGRVYVTADARTQSGCFSPFSVGQWVGESSCIPLGGIWNDEMQALSVGGLLWGDCGEVVEIDLTQDQRLGFSITTEGDYLTLGFNPESTTVDGNSEIQVTADANDSYGRRDALISLLSEGEFVEAHWDINTDMSSELNWCGASFEMGVRRTLENPVLWRFNGQGWESVPDASYICRFDGYTAVHSWLGDDYQGGLISLAVTAGEILSAAATLPGDLNGDGLVGADDLDLIRAQWGTADAVADVTMDGLVDSADLDVVRANWGTTTAAAAMPEPEVCVLLMLAVLFIVSRRP